MKHPTRHVTSLKKVKLPAAERKLGEALAAQFDERLRSLVDHCLSATQVGFTPSDFPESGLDQAELDAFLEGLG